MRRRWHLRHRVGISARLSLIKIVSLMAENVSRWNRFFPIKFTASFSEVFLWLHMKNIVK